MIIIKVTKNLGFNLSLEEKPHEHHSLLRLISG